MIDIAFGRPVRLRYLDPKSEAIESSEGTAIEPGSHYLEDEDGTIYSIEDVHISDFFGDIHASETGDIALVSGTEQDEQQVITRVLTGRPDWGYHPWIGADLEELRGLPNTKETAEQAVRQVIRTLTRDGRFDAQGIEVIPVPQGPNRLILFIFVGGGESAQAIPIEIDL